MITLKVVRPTSKGCARMTADAHSDIANEFADVRLASTYETSECTGDGDLIRGLVHCRS
jgi:hypothetical protein